MSTNNAAPTEVSQHFNRGLTDCLTEPGAAMPKRTQPASARQQIALIRSIANYADGREDRAIREITAVLAGATLAELAAARGTA